jgi:hypothetical protein
MIHCEKQALAVATIQTKYKILRHMIKDNIKLADPEAVKLYIKRDNKWSNGHKILAVFAYNEYAKMKGIQWTPPNYPKNARANQIKKGRNFSSLSTFAFGLYTVQRLSSR